MTTPAGRPVPPARNTGMTRRSGPSALRASCFPNRLLARARTRRTVRCGIRCAVTGLRLWCRGGHASLARRGERRGFGDRPFSWRLCRHGRLAGSSGVRLFRRRRRRGDRPGGWQGSVILCGLRRRSSVTGRLDGLDDRLRKLRPDARVEMREISLEANHYELTELSPVDPAGPVEIAVQLKASPEARRSSSVQGSA